MTIKESCNYIRTQLRSIGHQVLSTRVESSERVAEPGVDRGEVIANLTLSYRHVEDAIMRLGKAIQAIDGGVSCYDDTKGHHLRSVLDKVETASRAQAFSELEAEASAHIKERVEQVVTDKLAERTERAEICCSDLHPFHSVPAKQPFNT